MYEIGYIKKFKLYFALQWYQQYSRIAHFCTKKYNVSYLNYIAHTPQKKSPAVAEQSNGL